jgi:outer membrane lipoprotein-sorting protein
MNAHQPSSVPTGLARLKPVRVKLVRANPALFSLALLALSLPVAAQTAPASLSPPAALASKPAPLRVIPLPVARPERLAAAPEAVTAPSRPMQLAQTTTDTPVSIERINAALNTMNSLTGDFVQVNASGRRSSGKIYIQKPGRLRFEYDPPSPLEIVADGTSVVIRDRKLNTQDLYSLSQTPLKFLLRDRIDLTRDTKLLDLRSEPDRTTVTIEDKSTFGGTSRIALLFDKSQALRQWTVRDPQGYETTVTLSNLDLTRRPDPKLFNINYERILPER